MNTCGSQRIALLSVEGRWGNWELSISWAEYGGVEVSGLNGESQIQGAKQPSRGQTKSRAPM